MDKKSLDSKVVVISQSMYFPWCGLLDQVRMCDVFVHYDDVQFARGFFNRVQVKTECGARWISVPLANQHRGQTIEECLIDYSQDWIGLHRETLRHAYSRAPYIKDMLDLFDSVVTRNPKTLGELGRLSIRALVQAFCLEEPAFKQSAHLNINGSSSQRLCDITSSLQGRTYLTGHGALKYLNEQIFFSKGIRVECMKYDIASWAQPYGAFTPYVTALDCFAHLGPESKTVLKSKAIDWSEAKANQDSLNQVSEA